jgi:hypothetical protein
MRGSGAAKHIHSETTTARELAVTEHLVAQTPPETPVCVSPRIAQDDATARLQRLVKGENSLAAGFPNEMRANGGRNKFLRCRDGANELGALR